jgi:transposase
MPDANAGSMNHHLAAIAKQVAEGAHAAVLLDGAGYHKSRSLKVPANITLILLPRYSPEINSAENIREYLRKNRLSNTVFKSYDDIVDKACDAWCFFAANTDKVTSTTHRNWATVN